MQTVRDPFQPIGGCGVCAGAIIYATVSALNVGADSGGVDEHGRYLHFRYSGNLNATFRSNGTDSSLPDFVPQIITVEFDSMSRFVVPFEGRLELIGGSGQWKSFIYSPGRIDLADYRPTIHTLQTQLDAGQGMFIPDNHHIILGSNSGDTFTVLSTGTTIEPSLLLPGNSILPGLEIQSVKRTVVRTAWEG